MVRLVTPDPAALTMENLEIVLPAGATPAKVEQIIDAVITAAGLDVSLRGSLAKFPGCIHWHAKKPGATGTLEFTLWPQEQRAWLTVQSGRRAAWIEVILPAVQRQLQQRLAAGSARQPKRAR